MYEKLVKLLKAKLNKHPGNHFKEGFFSND